MEETSSNTESPDRRTRVLHVDDSKIGQFVFKNSEQQFLADWELIPTAKDHDFASLQEAAHRIRNTNVPVAFPTETVYGLGADATRSSAVRGIYEAKQRPSDNPLIVHIASLAQLRRLLMPDYTPLSSTDPIPSVYHSLIERFWPGPLTILLPLPSPSPFAREVTSTLSTVGVRMPCSRLALALIYMAGVPLAAPSANASTKPSPTTAAHVLHDLNTRIDLIIDGGPCDVGVESTVVDGLSQPPLVLRPGGISVKALSKCPGWSNVQIGYKDGTQLETPRAPGMKYKHYSPKARVILVRGPLNKEFLRRYQKVDNSIGILRTKTWDITVNSLGIAASCNSTEQELNLHSDSNVKIGNRTFDTASPVSTSLISTAQSFRIFLSCEPTDLSEGRPEAATIIWTIGLGSIMANIARGLFSALRDLDSKDVGVIFVEGVDDQEGDAAAAVMNRLRKAAEKEIVA